MITTKEQGRGKTQDLTPSLSIELNSSKINSQNQGENSKKDFPMVIRKLR